MQDEVRERNEFESRYGNMESRISTGRLRRGGLSAMVVFRLLFSL